MRVVALAAVLLGRRTFPMRGVGGTSDVGWAEPSGKPMRLGGSGVGMKRWGSVLGRGAREDVCERYCGEAVVPARAEVI